MIVKKKEKALEIIIDEYETILLDYYHILRDMVDYNLKLDQQRKHLHKELGMKVKIIKQLVHNTIDRLNESRLLSTKDKQMVMRMISLEKSVSEKLKKLKVLKESKIIAKWSDSNELR